MNAWEIHTELVSLDGVEIEPRTPEEVDAHGDLQRFFMQDYKPEDWESPCHSLDQLHSFRWSVPIGGGAQRTLTFPSVVFCHTNVI
jgi:hypothetical protein